MRESWAQAEKELTVEQLLWIARSHGINVPDCSLLGFYRDLMSTTHIENVDSVCTSQERVQKTAKSEQVPLRQAQIIAMYDVACDVYVTQDARAIEFARAIEKAHGIKGQKV